MTENALTITLEREHIICTTNTMAARTVMILAMVHHGILKTTATMATIRRPWIKCGKGGQGRRNGAFNAKPLHQTYSVDEHGFGKLGGATLRIA